MQLQLVSQDPKNLNRILRPYLVDDIDTVGVDRGAPFEVRFQNTLDQKVEVRISIDGTDVTTGRPASIDPRNGDLIWVVRPHGSLRLAAWQENDVSGARFVFTNAEDSVAVHTHDNSLGALGYVSVAVYTDKTPNFAHFGRGGHNLFGTALSNEPVLRGAGHLGVSYQDSPATYGTATRSAVGTGAGEQIEQRISRVPGLRDPELHGTVQLRYLWWDELVARLQEDGIKPPRQHPQGFFQTAPTLADLGSTPRPGQQSATGVAVDTEYPQYL